MRPIFPRSWIIGEPSDYLYGYMVENILESRFRLTLDDAQGGRIIELVLVHLKMSISADVAQR